MFGGRELPTEESDWGRAVCCDLLQGCSDGVVAGVRQELEFGVLGGEGKENRVADALLGIFKGFLKSF